MKYLLIILAFAILYYYFFYRKWVRRKKNVYSDMVMDKVCKKYVLKKEALKLQLQGEEHYFCSEKCMKEFLERLESKPQS